MQDRTGTIWMVTVVDGMHPTVPVCPESLSLCGPTSSLLTLSPKMVSKEQSQRMVRNLILGTEQTSLQVL